MSEYLGATDLYCAISICSACVYPICATCIPTPIHTRTHTRTHIHKTSAYHSLFRTRVDSPNSHWVTIYWGPSLNPVRLTGVGSFALIPHNTILLPFLHVIACLASTRLSLRIQKSSTTRAGSHARASGQIRTPGASMCLACQCVLTSNFYLFYVLVLQRDLLHMWNADGNVDTTACIICCAFCICRLLLRQTVC